MDGFGLSHDGAYRPVQAGTVATTGQDSDAHGPSLRVKNGGMAWDATRPIPWARLSREWLIYAVVMIVAFAVFLRDSVTGASVLGLAASYPMYLGFGAVLARFGYQRKTFRDLRRETVATSRSNQSNGSADVASHRRSRPAPTKRTTTGPSQHRSNKSRKKNRR